MNELSKLRLARFLLSTAVKSDKVHGPSGIADAAIAFIACENVASIPHLPQDVAKVVFDIQNNIIEVTGLGHEELFNRAGVL